MAMSAAFTCEWGHPQSEYNLESQVTVLRHVNNVPQPKVTIPGKTLPSLENASTQDRFLQFVGLVLSTFVTSETVLATKRRMLT